MTNCQDPTWDISIIKPVSNDLIFDRSFGLLKEIWIDSGPDIPRTALSISVFPKFRISRYLSDILLMNPESGNLFDMYGSVFFFIDGEKKE